MKKNAKPINRTSTHLHFRRLAFFQARRAGRSRVSAPRLRHRRSAARLYAQRLHFWNLGHPGRLRRPRRLRATTPHTYSIWVPRTPLDCRIQSFLHDSALTDLHLATECLRTASAYSPRPFPDLAGGAAASAATKRKRWEKTSLAADQTLANALTKVLQQWQHQGDSTKSTPPKRRRPAPPSKPVTATSSNSLAVQLHTLLTESQSQDTTDQQLAHKLLALLAPYTHAQRPSNGAPPPTRTVTLQSQPPANINNRWRRSNKDPTNTAITHLVSHEWTAPPTLGHSTEILQAIRTGNTLPKANITEVWSLTEAEALRTAWRAHGLTTSLTLLLYGPAKKLDSATHTRIRTTRGRQGQRVEEVALLALGTDGNHPWTQKAIKVNDTTSQIIPRHTLRIAAPAEFRQYFHDTHDKPHLIVADMAQWETTLRAGALTGGQWNETWSKHDSLVVGYLRLPCKDAEKLVPHSGTRGIFVNIQETDSLPKPITWIARDPSEGPDQYLSRCQQQAQTKNSGLFYCKGHATNNLGILAPRGDPATRSSRFYLIRGVPRQWEAEEITTFLTDQKWSALERFTKSKFKPEWKFRAIPPDEKEVYHYSFNEFDTISCFPAPRKPTAMPASWPVPNTWKGTPYSKRDSADQKDTRSPSDTKSEAHPVLDKSSNDVSKARSRSPPPQRSKSEQISPSTSTTLPANPTDALAQGWSRQDLKGNGDCCFRAIAAAKSKAKHNKLLTEQEASVAGAELRSLMVAHTRKHKDRLQEWFSPDPNEPSSQRAHQAPATTIEEWCTNMEHQGTWADGLAIHSLAERTGLSIVVWKKEISGTWSRYTFAPKFNRDDVATARQGEKPLCIILEDKHYTTLHPPDKVRVPRPWLFKTLNRRESIIIDLTGAGRSLASRTPSSLHTCRSAPSSAVASVAPAPAPSALSPVPATPTTLHSWFTSAPRRSPAHTNPGHPCTPPARERPTRSCARRPHVGATSGVSSAQTGAATPRRDRRTAPAHTAPAHIASAAATHTTTNHSNAGSVPLHVVQGSVPQQFNSERTMKKGEQVLDSELTLKKGEHVINSEQMKKRGEQEFNSERVWKKGEQKGYKPQPPQIHEQPQLQQTPTHTHHAGSVPQPRPQHDQLHTTPPLLGVTSAISTAISTPSVHSRPETEQLTEHTRLSLSPPHFRPLCLSPPLSNPSLVSTEGLQPPALSAAAIQMHQQQAQSAPLVRKTFPSCKIRKRVAARPKVDGWYNWQCPVCSETIRVKGHNNGRYYKNKHLKMIHNTTLLHHPGRGRSDLTFRCQLRAKQMQQMVPPADQHDLVHVKSAGLTSCVPKSTTWICKRCLGKGSTNDMYQWICTSTTIPAMRAKWWSKLSCDQKQL